MLRLKIPTLLPLVLLITVLLTPSLEHQWNETGTVKYNYSEKGLSQLAYCILHISLGLTKNQTLVSEVTGRQLTTREVLYLETIAVHCRNRMEKVRALGGRVRVLCGGKCRVSSVKPGSPTSQTLNLKWLNHTTSL